METSETEIKNHAYKDGLKEKNFSCNKDCKNCKNEEPLNFDQIKKDINQQIKEKKDFFKTLQV